MKIERIGPLTRLTWHLTSLHLSRKKGQLLAALLFSCQEKFAQVASDLSPPLLSSSSPPLLRYPQKKASEPILYLILETKERPRLVPGNSLLFRSLGKGKGVLKQNRERLYLEIENPLIQALIPHLLKTYRFIRLPYLNRFGIYSLILSAIGALFLPIQELNQEFSFQIEGLYSTVEGVLFFKLKSAQLEALRQRYFLPAYAFHIPVAVEKRSRPLPILRINPAYLAA